MYASARLSRVARYERKYPSRWNPTDSRTRTEAVLSGLGGRFDAGEGLTLATADAESDQAVGHAILTFTAARTSGLDLCRRLRAGPGPVRVGPSLLSPDDVDRDLHRRNRSSVLKPVCGVPILGPAHSRPIVHSDSISMVGDRSLQYVDDAGSVLMVVNRAEDASRLDGHHTHSKLTPCHALDLRAKVNRCKYLARDTLRVRCRLFVAHPGLLAS
jgi:hypothetical protein